MSHTTYKTTSNTLLLRRLISNLKERGSDVAGELEGRALDLLSDVQTRKKKTKVAKFESDEDSSSSDWEDAPEIPNVKLYIPPPKCETTLERKTPNPPPIPPTPQIFTLPTPPTGISTPPVGTVTPPTPLFFTPPTSPIAEFLAPNLPLVSVSEETEVIPEKSPEPVRQIVRRPKLNLTIQKDVLSASKKDTPSLSAETTRLTPDCKLYWIQKHMEQEKEQAEKSSELSDNLDQMHLRGADNKIEIEETLEKEFVAQQEDNQETREVNVEFENLNICKPIIAPKLKKMKDKKADEEESVKEQAKKLKVAGPRSKKPTLARVWRKEKEKQKMEIKNEILPCL